MVFSVISIVLLFYAYINYKKSVMLFAIYQTFWYTTQLANISGLSLNTTVAMIAVYIILYFFKNNNLYVQSFPYKIPFVIAICSLLLSCFGAALPSVELSRAMMRILRDYLFIWLLWNVVETKKDFIFLVKGFSIVMFGAAFYGLIEYVMGSNPLLDYKVKLSGDTISLYDMAGLRGYRLTSCFEHPLGAGMTFGLFAIFIIVIWINKEEKIPYKFFSIMTSFFCIACVFLTKMRSGILFTIILALALVNLKNIKKRRFYYLIIMIICALPAMYIVLNQNLNIILNLFTSTKSSSIGGSSLAMRLSQLEAVLGIMKTSPIIGLGEMFRTYITRTSLTDAALGYESVWFEQAVMHGMVGLISTVIMIYYSVIKIPKKFHSKESCIFFIAYWIVYSFSSIPSFRLVMFYLAQFYFIKTSNVYLENKPKNKIRNRKKRIRFKL